MSGDPRHQDRGHEWRHTSAGGTRGRGVGVTVCRIVELCPELNREPTATAVVEDHPTEPLELVGPSNPAVPPAPIGPKSTARATANEGPRRESTSCRFAPVVR